jgi:mono/diheme cytochrome c family protein
MAMFRRASQGWAVVLFLLVVVALGPAACDDDEGPVVDASTGTDARDMAAPDTQTPDSRPDMLSPDTSADTRDGSAPDGSDGPTGDGPPALTAVQARGKYLVDHVIACPECHTPRLQNGALDMSKYMAGDTNCFVKLPNNDCIYARNLTPDNTGLGTRTPAEIKKMFMEGLRPPAAGGEPLHPIMPYYVFGNMDGDDADAIVAYLQVIPPVAQTIPLKGASFQVAMAAPPIDMAAVPEPAGDYDNPAAATRGRYLATQVGLCVECHTPHLMGGATALYETKYFHGGESFDIPTGPMMMITARSKNLTPDTTGLGTWTVDDIVKVLKEGKDKMNMGICPPMPVGPMGAYGGLTTQDARDIAHYLKSIPPATSTIMDMCSFPPGP